MQAGVVRRFEMGMKTRRIQTISVALLLAALSFPLFAQAESAAVAGRVTAVDGTATAQQPGQEPRALRCGDPVYADDRLDTAKDGRLGVLLGDVFAQLPEKSGLQLGHTADLTPDVRLERGGVRLIDPRDSGSLGYLAALDARAEVMGNDVEAYVFREKVGPYAMLCEWDAPLRVARADERGLASPGNCIIAKRNEPLYVAKAHDHRIAALADELCEIDPGALAALAGDPARHLTPAAVAAAGPLAGAANAGFGESTPGSHDVFSPEACDSPGSGCASALPLTATGGGGGPFPGFP
jgi:hypothetical protein